MERPLRVLSSKQRWGRLWAGELECRACGTVFPIREGIPILIRRQPGYTGYEDKAIVANYLYLHYGDLLDSGGGHILFYEDLLDESTTFLEIGCGPGRITVEMARKAQMAIGIDISFELLRPASRLTCGLPFRFQLPLEGKLTSSYEILPHLEWGKANITFLVADALYLPFPKGVFQTVASINLLDRVFDPLRALREMNRVMMAQDASLLVADPFSWLPEYTPPSKWLGGKRRGRIKGRGFENLKAILEGRLNIFRPPLTCVASGQHQWALRVHENRQELIRSLYIKAKR